MWSKAPFDLEDFSFLVYNKEGWVKVIPARHGGCRRGPRYLSVKVKSPSFKAGTFFRGFTWAKASLRCWPVESPA